MVLIQYHVRALYWNGNQVLYIWSYAIYLAQDVDRPVLADANLGDGDGSGGAVKDGFFSTFELLFFALFGLVDPENLPPVNNSPLFAIYLAKGVFGIYLIITIIVLINLLIAMMSDTYQRIQVKRWDDWHKNGRHIAEEIIFKFIFVKENVRIFI